MFLLEVIVAGAPLIGLLGTVTGLVEVFSQMPTGGAVDKSLFTQGISLALLTTMTGSNHCPSNNSFQCLPPSSHR